MINFHKNIGKVLSAFNDPELRRRVLLTVPQPKTLTAAFNLTGRAIILDVTENPERRGISRSRTDQQTMRKQYQAQSVAKKLNATTADPHQMNNKQLVGLQTAVVTPRTAPWPTKVKELIDNWLIQ